MEIFVVGGSVRDTLLNRESKDVDFVVVGSSPNEMVEAGFKQVGLDFPVFLHPETGDEYALARIERKTGVGYNGFDCDTNGVTLIEDLSRRDLTINSMAVRIEDWDNFVQTKDPTLVIDPFGGINDLNNHILRHTSEAFAEDPVRVLRAARFAARFNFTISDDTIVLMKQVVNELNHVSTDRIWAEFAKGLMEDHPHVMMQMLFKIEAFNVEVMRPFGDMSVTTRVRIENLKSAEGIRHLPTRFAIISKLFTSETYVSHRIPSDCAELSTVINNNSTALLNFDRLPKKDRLTIIMKLRALTRIDFIHTVIDTMNIMFGKENNGADDLIFRDIANIEMVDAAAIASQFNSGEEIREQIFQSRLIMME